MARGFTLALTILAITVAAAQGAAPHHFVHAKDSPLNIVVPPGADEVTTFAAGELGRYLVKIVGCRADVVADGKTEIGSPQIHVGATAVASRLAAEAAADLPDDGFVIRTVPSVSGQDECRLVIVGSNRRGTLYGVYSLLEDHLGCRWFEPGEEGEFVPTLDSVDLSGINCKESPSLPHRCLRIRHVYEGAGLCDYIDWQAKQRMNYLYWHGSYREYADRRKTTEPFHENRGRLLSFVAQRGFIVDNSSHSFERFCPEGRVDMSSKECEDTMLAEILDHLQRNPFIDYLGLWLGDGWGGFADTGPESCTLDYPDTRLITLDLDWRATTDKVSITNSYVDFVNRTERRVQQVHPNVSLTLIAYNRSLLAPDKVKCSPGQQVHVGFRRSYSYGFGDPASNWNSLQAKELDRWLAACDHVVFFEYYQTGNLGSVGRPFPRTIAQDLKYLKQVGAAGTASQSRSDLFRSLGPNYYTYAKCSWNVDLDVESVLSDYYRAAYGPAAGTVKELFDIWEQTYNQGGDYFRYNWKVIVPLFTPEVREKMLTLAEEAKTLAGTATPGQYRRTEELGYVIEAFDAFMRLAQTGAPDAKKKMIELNKAHSFVRAAISPLEKAGILHDAGL